MFHKKLPKNINLHRYIKEEVNNQNTVRLLLFLSSAVANPRFTLLVHIVAILGLL